MRDLTPWTRSATAAIGDAPVDCECELARWFARRRYRSAPYTPARVLAAKGRTQVTVIVPVRECAQTIGEVIEVALAPALAAGVIDELVVIDAASADGSGEIALAAGVRVVQQDEIATAMGPALGKGDAMWRALQITGGDVVCFMDGDTRDPEPAHLLNLHAPLLAGFSQPLAGELAARRYLLEEIPFAVGCGVETAMLLDALAECHLGTRQNRHQPLRALGEMAYAVLAALELRRPGATPPSGRYVRPWDGGAAIAVPVNERPPLRDRAAARQRTAQASRTGVRSASDVRP
jgi:glucosyl-3-phosphoglycerate synthase